MTQSSRRGGNIILGGPNPVPEIVANRRRIFEAGSGQMVCPAINWIPSDRKPDALRKIYSTLKNKYPETKHKHP
jgi:hypothetical protein